MNEPAQVGGAAAEGRVHGAGRGRAKRRTAGRWVIGRAESVDAAGRACFAVDRAKSTAIRAGSAVGRAAASIRRAGLAVRRAASSTGRAGSAAKRDGSAVERTSASTKGASSSSSTIERGISARRGEVRGGRDRFIPPERTVRGRSGPTSTTGIRSLDGCIHYSFSDLFSVGYFKRIVIGGPY